MRERQANLFVGAPGRGKSSALVEVLEGSKEKNILIYKHAFNLDDKALKNFPVVKFKEYKGGWAKISSADVDYRTFIELVYKFFRNGALVIDDAQLYERDILSKLLNDMLIMRRHISVDIYLVYHGCSVLPIQSFPFINNIFLWQTADNFDYKASKLPNYEALKAAKAHLDAVTKNAKPGDKKYHYCVRIKLS